MFYLGKKKKKKNTRKNNNVLYLALVAIPQLSTHPISVRGVRILMGFEPEGKVDVGF